MEKFISGVKGLMQPALTLVAVILFLAMSLSGQFPAADVFKVIVAIIVFWFGYTGIKNFTFSNGKKEEPPKANGGTPTSGGASAVGTASTVGTGAEWGGNIPSGGDSYTIPQPPPVKPFNQAEWDAALVKSANSNVTWAKGWAEKDPGIMAQVAIHVFTILPPCTPAQGLPYLKATIPYIERWFKYAWFGNPDFDCGGINCLRYAQDQKSCACGDTPECKHITEAMKGSKTRLTNCYDLRTKWSNAGE